MTTDKMERHFETLNDYNSTHETSLSLRVGLDYYAL